MVLFIIKYLISMKNATNFFDVTMQTEKNEDDISKDKTKGIGPLSGVITFFLLMIWSALEWQAIIEYFNFSENLPVPFFCVLVVIYWLVLIVLGSFLISVIMGVLMSIVAHLLYFVLGALKLD